MTPRSYGHVYLGRYKETGQLLAIKMMKMISDMHSIKKEIHMLKDCDCNHVVRYFGSYLKDDHVWVGFVGFIQGRLSLSIVVVARCATWHRRGSFPYGRMKSAIFYLECSLVLSTFMSAALFIVYLPTGWMNCVGYQSQQCVTDLVRSGKTGGLWYFHLLARWLHATSYGSGYSLLDGAGSDPRILL